MELERCTTCGPSMLTKDFSEVANRSWAFTINTGLPGPAPLVAHHVMPMRKLCNVGDYFSTSASGQGTIGASSRYAAVPELTAMPLTLFQHQTKIKRS